MPEGITIARTKWEFLFFWPKYRNEELKFPRKWCSWCRFGIEASWTWCCSCFHEGTKSKKRAAEVQKSKSPKKPKIVKDVKKSRKKSKGDGPQVKRASSAYIHFTTDFRKTLKEKCEKNGDPLPKANEVAKMAGEQWKKLTAEEKKPYDLKAQADKERYLKEVRNDFQQDKARTRS